MYWETFDNLCKDNHVSYAEVARQTDISKVTISAWKKGEYTPKMDKLQRIAAYFNVPIDYFTQVNREKYDRMTPEEIERTEIYRMIERVDPKEYETLKRYIAYMLLAEDIKKNDDRKNQ